MKCRHLVYLMALLVPAASADIQGKVVKVTDGDTVHVLYEGERYKVRLTGIDAPELSQPYGKASKKYLTSLVAGKQVFVESKKSDRYGRILDKVWVQPSDCKKCDKTLDANHAQLLAGMAWWYRYYAKEQQREDRGRYESAEEDARKRKLGLWAESNPVPPWDWRRGKHQSSVRDVPTSTKCGSKKYCRDMNSCEEAKFYLSQCGRSSLDGDKDGVPCESICR